LSIGLAVYNGENYLAESLDALLGQSYDNFELIISDNASTDGTADIRRDYEKQDSRNRYVRQPRNIGPAPNHNFVFKQAREELFKWASHDDLYARDLLKRCVDALDENSRVVLAHSWTALVDDSGAVTKLLEYPLDTASPLAPERSRSMLFANGGDDVYRVVRADVLRQTPLHGSHHHADRTITTDIALLGPFYQVPGWLDSGATTQDGENVRARRCAPVHEHGPAPGGPVAAPGRTVVRRIHPGVCHGDPACAAVVRRPAGMLPPPGGMDDEPPPAAGPPSNRPSRAQPLAPSTPSSPSRPG